MADDDIRIRELGAPGDLGWVVLAHGEVYAEEFGWTTEFEALVARRVALRGVVGDDLDDARTAKLRILLVHPDGRGHGLGGRLVDTCLAFARDVGYERVRLWTNHPLAAARHLYLERGFALTGEEPHHSFGHDLVGQTYELALAR